jgi:hypothetical protein
MTKFSRKERSVTATLRGDGTVYFDVERESKPITIQMLDWTLAALWCSVGAVLVATLFAL